MSGADIARRAIEPYRKAIIERCLKAARQDEQDYCHTENIRLLATYPYSARRARSMENLLAQIQDEDLHAVAVDVVADHAQVVARDAGS